MPALKETPVPAVKLNKLLPKDTPEIVELLNWLLAILPSVPPNVRLPLLVTVPVSVIPLTVPVPDTEVTDPLPLLLKVVQSAELNAPLFVALAVGTFNVITGVVVPFATVLDKSVPVVPRVNAATLVTVPPLPVADRVPVAKEIPLPIVTFENPPEPLP